MNQDSKWSKYGLTTLEVLFSAFSVYISNSDKLDEEVLKRDGINISLRYLKHPSIWICYSASRIFRLALHRTLGSEFRKNNDCLAIINDLLPVP